MEKLGIECKQLMSKEIEERLKGASDLFITSFSSLTVPEQENLRRKLKEIDASLFVVKNRFAKRTLQQLNLEGIGSLMGGLTAITMGGSDVICTSRALVDFAGKHENFKILGGYVDKQLLDQSSIKRLASIPSKEALLTQIVFGFNSPIQGLVNTLSGTIKKIILVINSIRKKEEEKNG